VIRGDTLFGRNVAEHSVLLIIIAAHSLASLDFLLSDEFFELKLQKKWVFQQAASRLGVESAEMTDFRIGTSAFTAAGWETAFYPAGMKPADHLSYYATKFITVEVDSTFYRTPSVATVNGWERKTPRGFLPATKIPQIITHESVLQDCDEDLNHFLETMDLMGDKLGPLLLQFGYFNRTVFRSGGDFLARLEPFLAKLPKGYKFAVEIRNRNWLSKPFFDLLRAHKVAYALIDQSWMPRPAEIFEKFDPITADFTYIWLLGDRTGIEKQTKIWDNVIVDRSRELMSWVNVCQRTIKRGVSTYVYVNNHYELCRRRHNAYNAAFRIMPN
jgi:uncharacterized protein YecE (DUF72 family)